MAGNLNSGMCSPLCSDVCAFYLPQGLTTVQLMYIMILLFLLFMLVFECGNNNSEVNSCPALC